MRVFIVCVCLCAGQFAGQLAAQFEYGEILGTVRDSSGGVVPRAKITLRNSDTNVESSLLTNEQGNYSFPDLRAGNYRVSGTAEGFRPVESSARVLRIGDRLRIDLALETGQITEQVTVAAEATPLLETDTSSRGQVILSQQIEQLPLNKRDYTQLVLLVPGTTYNPDQRLGGAFSINGNRTLQNNYLLDGADNNSNATSFRGERVDVIRPSVDAVEEFRVLSNSYSAEYGRSAGAVVNVSIKGGTNAFHGATWEFFRNDDMDAHGWTPTVGGVKPKVRFNLFGANVGGPIRQDKTFFFVNYEGERNRDGVIYQGIVPTPAMELGDFSSIPAGFSSALRITPVDPSSRVPFPNGIIPRSQWSPVAAKILSNPDFPVPNALPFIETPGAYINTVTNHTRSDKFDVRIDHYVTSQWRLFGRYSFSDLELFRPAQFKGYVEGSFNDGFGTTATRGQNAVLGNTVSLTPSSILDLRIGYTRLGANVFPPNFGTPSATQILGIPNLPASPKINAGWPKFNVTGMSSFGSTTSQPQYQIPNVYLASGVLSLQRGKHSIRTGADVQYIQTAILDVSSLRGTFTFTNGDWTNNPWGDFLLGLPAAYTQTSYNVAYNRVQLYNIFVQDDFRVLPNLTLNLGLRYEYSTPIYEKNNHLTNFNQSTGALVFATDSGVINRSLVRPDRLNFSPRIGFAWTVMPKLVIRSGYGFFYNHTNRQGREGLLAENPPYVHDLTRTQGPGSTGLITLDGGPPPDYFASARPSDQVVRGDDPNLRNGRVQQWNFTVQYSIARDWLFEVGYVGNRGTRLTRFWNPNQPLVAGPSATLAARRPFLALADIEYMDSGGSSFYHGLQTRLEKRYSNGLTLLHSFTWSRGINNIGAWNDPNGSIYPQNAYDFRSEKGLEENTVKLASVASWVYQLPFGHGRKMMTSASRLVEATLGNWQIGGIWNWRTGLPLTISSAACGNCAMGSNRQTRADVVPGVSAAAAHQSAASWFNTAAFAPQSTPFGTVGRATIWGPGLQQWDLSFDKNFVLSESRYFQFRGELFNAFNQVNYEPPGSSVTTGGFGVITAALPGRNVQFGLKFYW